MHDVDFVSGLVVGFDESFFKPVTHGDDTVLCVHPFFLDGFDEWVDAETAALVVLGDVDVCDERFPCDFFELFGGRVCYPVVGVDDVEVFIVKHRCDDVCEPIHFFFEVTAVQGVLSVICSFDFVISLAVLLLGIIRAEKALDRYKRCFAMRICDSYFETVRCLFVDPLVYVLGAFWHHECDVDAEVV